SDPAGGSCDCDTHGTAPFVRVLLVDERGAARGTGRERSGIARQPRPDLEVVAEVLLEPYAPEEALADVAAALGASLRRIVLDADPELSPQRAELPECPCGQQPHGLGRDPAAAGLRRDDVPELDRPAVSVDLRHEREAEERPRTVDDRERLARTVGTPVLVPLEPVSGEAIRHRHGDARVAQDVRVRKQGLDAPEMAAVEPLETNPLHAPNVPSLQHASAVE